LLLPSRGYEAHSVALLEAGVAGVPRIAADIPGSEEIITHGETGLLFRTGNIGDLAARIAVLMDDPALACRLGTAGRNDVLQRFSSERFRRSFEDAYQEVMALRPSRLGRLASLPVEAVAVIASLQSRPAPPASNG
jgi:glycosyltransferase involved in cell wall biosynthesis